MFESIPLADFMNEFENLMGCWKNIVFAGIAIKEGQNYNPIALQAWAGSDEQEHTVLFKTPELPNGVCMFKITRWLPRAWPMIEDILAQKPIALDEDTIINFADFNFENAAFLTSAEYHDEYPKELNKYIGGWPKLYLRGKFENRARLLQEFNGKVNQEFSTGKYNYPTLQDAASHLIDIRVTTAYQWGLLYLVLTLPIKLKAQVKTYIKGEKVLARLELPSRLDRLSIDLRCLVESKLGQRFESIPAKKVTNSGGGQVFSSTLALHSGERCREVSLHLGGKRVISASVEEPILGTVAVAQNHAQISAPAETTSDEEVFGEQQHRRYDAFVVHESSTGNSIAYRIKQGAERFGITTFVAPQDVQPGADEEYTRQSALLDAREIFVIITQGLIDRPGEARNELVKALNAGKQAIIRPYRKMGITPKEAVEFLKRMGITVSKQCPEFDDESGVIEDILRRRRTGEYFIQPEINKQISEKENENLESKIDQPQLIKSGDEGESLKVQITKTEIETITGLVIIYITFQPSKEIQLSKISLEYENRIVDGKIRLMPRNIQPPYFRYIGLPHFIKSTVVYEVEFEFFRTIEQAIIWEGGEGYRMKSGKRREFKLKIQANGDWRVFPIFIPE